MPPVAFGAKKSTSMTTLCFPCLTKGLYCSVHGWRQLSAEQIWPGVWEKYGFYFFHSIMWPSCDWCPLVETGVSSPYKLDKVLAFYIWTYCDMFGRRCHVQILHKDESGFSKRVETLFTLAIVSQPYIGIFCLVSSLPLCHYGPLLIQRLGTHNLWHLSHRYHPTWRRYCCWESSVT